ncbi:MAG: fructose 1,6-bisphosphatase, partial [Dehalococcoidia bacterium]|nr:fructose 1,6-bisphosphatase [Dehalococcoidia bacterium]
MAYMKVTLSVIKADVGGYVGHSSSHPRLLEKADSNLSKAKKEGLLIDYHVTRCGDDLELIMTHTLGEDNESIHVCPWS